MALPNGKFSGSRWTKGSPGLVFSFMLGFQILQSLGQTTPNHVVSTGHSSRGPNIGVLLLRFGWRLEAANKKPFQSAWAAQLFGFRFSLVGLGGRAGEVAAYPCPALSSGFDT